VVPLLQRGGAEAIDVLKFGVHAHLSVGGFGAVHDRCRWARWSTRDAGNRLYLSRDAWGRRPVGRGLGRGAKGRVRRGRMSVHGPASRYGVERLGGRPQRRFRGAAGALRRLSPYLHRRYRRGAEAAGVVGPWTCSRWGITAAARRPKG
jgi:hypothetical protein